MPDRERLDELWRLYKDNLAMTRVYAYHIAMAVADGQRPDTGDVSHFRSYRAKASRYLDEWAEERDRLRGRQRIS